MSSSGNNSSANSSRNPYSFADFSLRRLLLQGARAARGSPQLGGTRLCDVERGGGGGGTSGSGGGMDGRGGASRHEKAASVATGSVGPTVTVHASGSAASGGSRTTGDDATSQHSGAAAHGSPSTSTGATATSVTPHTLAAANGTGTLECPLCCIKCSPDDFYLLWQCRHFACRVCLVRYLMIEILESRTDIACPECAQAMHPSDIQALLVHNPVTVRKYEDFMVRRVLLADPDSRWCPAPDCSYAVIASGCASCPRIRCERPGCDINFCYHCKAEWHPDQTCDAARAARHSPMSAPSGSLSQDSQHRDDIKPCPRCQVLIVKMDDGSCNHMVCAVCGSEFCWLCMKVISDLHYLSPSGCTFWGKKPWSRKKKLLWQLGTLVGAPVGIALVAGIAVPAMIIGIPVWVGRKVHTRYKEAGKHKRNCAVLSGVIASVLVSPVLAGLAVAIGVPILLFYVYGVVPVSLCRAGCGVSTTRDGFKFDFDEEGGNAARHQADAASADAVSRLGATSIGEVSLSVASGTHLPAQTHQPSSGSGGLPTGGAGGSGGGAGGASVGGGCSATAGTTSVSNVSTAALAGSITGNRLEVSVDVSTSETASAVTCVSDKSSGLQNDTASTKALAGSLLSYRQALDASNFSEDGMSERVRFDNVCYVIDGRKTGSDQELSADKASVGSCRSFRSSDRSFRDDVGDSASLSSLHKRIMNVQQRLAKTQQQQNAQQSQRTTTNASSSSNITPQHSSVSSSSPAVVVPSKQASAAAPATTSADLSCDNNQSGSCTPQQTTASAHGSPTSQSSFVGGGSSSAALAATSAAATTTTTTTKSLNTKNMSKVAILRNLFFSQHSDGGGGSGGSGGGGGNSSSSSGGDKT